ncbi:MAG TPA: hypothetical protein VFE77_03035 [Rhodanobacter sp.]|nr:hypothetical protein [Rhodanobacter sp.]
MIWICRVQETIVAGPALPAIAIAATVASTAMSAYGAYSQGQAQSAQAKYQQQVAQNNAVMKQRAEVSTASQATVTETYQALQDAALKGRETAAEGASGTDVNQGSALNTTSNTAADAVLNQKTVAYNASMQEYDEAAQADYQQGQAGQFGAASQNALTAGTIGAAGSVLSGPGSVADKWYKFNQAGVS